MEELVWHDCRELTIEGRAWDDTRSYYDRLPARACGVVRDPVWDLAQHAAGICCRFATDATAIHARWELRYESLAMPHMPATGVSGLDLYVRVGGAWRWAGVGQPTQFPVNTAALASGMAAGQREYLLYLPLYNGVHRVEVGVSREATVTPGPARRADRRLPMVFYGTSITQGGVRLAPWHGPCGDPRALARPAGGQPGFLRQRDHGPVRGATDGRTRGRRLGHRLRAQHDR